jgi:hypothetical protein
MRALVTDQPGRRLQNVCANLWPLLSAADASFTVDDIEWGRGNGPSRRSAKEAAAEQVLVALEVHSQET